MYIVNGSNSKGIVSSEHASLDEAIAKAAEFIKLGMGHIGVLDLDRKTYTEAEIDLLIELAKVEHKGLPKPGTPVKK